MSIAQQLYEAAKQLVNKRYPGAAGGAAAIRTASGKILTSTAPIVKNDALNFCHETGAYLEAHKLDEAVTHSLCLSREAADTDFVILTPCGICQEWLTFWGGDVLAAISTPNNELVFKPLRELQPHHWSMVNGDIL